MNVGVGIAFLVIGNAVILVALALVIAEIISGRHGAAPLGNVMAGFNWNGMTAVLNGLAAIFKALAQWPPAALLILLGIILDGAGVWILAVKPF